MLGMRKRGKNDTVQIQLLDGIGLILTTATASTEATAITVTVTTASTEATAIAITITTATTATTATRHYSTPSLFHTLYIIENS
ncbi:hypothetical protein ABD73_19120 [Brevibacillus laterosporus]|nr:hypothetical protein [Brevibacillus laterosporus]